MGFSTDLFIVLISIHGVDKNLNLLSLIGYLDLGQGFGGNCGFLRSKDWL